MNRIEAELKHYINTRCSMLLTYASFELMQHFVVLCCCFTQNVYEMSYDSLGFTEAIKQKQQPPSRKHTKCFIICSGTV